MDLMEAVAMNTTEVITIWEALTMVMEELEITTRRTGSVWTQEAIMVLDLMQVLLHVTALKS